mmetsp:Transcript_37065/g.37730  ORF Transcript_37065/g.37730 Transcript_37065/m.37730 type:complete len:210 (+) Transcript_37065:84-713(+)|eukprot:CAMPEP_0182430650 /NCGR_PEP_ID=MMETSP1167-20130531/42271_1 /TAXON_ID=2988 /ORGANISM="Mallomonas Sp, Strain CCMP3275" /LENGTH=209 /DNA_ID=CAMNT_0024615991 /DNA_START=71 /DNA_END=700 /DNA_ORIENTATION=+
MAASIQLPNFMVSVVSEDHEQAISEIIRNRPCVIDFWTTQCVRCPSALEKLNKLAKKYNPNDLLFMSCNLDDKETAAELLQGNFPHMSHIFMDITNKQLAKDTFSFKQVPFVLIVNKKGQVIQADFPSNINFPTILPSLLTATETEQNDIENTPLCSNNSANNKTADGATDLKGVTVGLGDATSTQESVSTSFLNPQTERPAFVLDEDF